MSASLTPATTHITRLASSFIVQMVNAYDLRDAMDLSTDHPDGTPHDPRFITLLQKKYGNCSPWFLENLRAEGIKEPLVILILPDGRWQFDNGHHRLSYALLNNLDVPVVFDDSMVEGDDIELNDTFLRVGRQDVDEHHAYEGPDAEPPPGDDTPTDCMAMVIPIQRSGGRHREKAAAGGRHRMA